MLNNTAQTLFFIVKIFYQFKLLLKRFLIVEYLSDISAVFSDCILDNSKPFRYTVKILVRIVA